LEGRFFSSCIWCGEWTVQCLLRQWTFHASFIGEGVGRDLFAFQPMGRPKVLCFYSFLSLAGRKGCFVHFSLVPNVFSQCSPKFLMGSQYVPQHIFHLSTALLFHMRWQMLFFFHLYGRLKGGTIYIKTEPSILRSLHSFIFWGTMGQSNWLVDPRPKKNWEGTLCLY